MLQQSPNSDQNKKAPPKGPASRVLTELKSTLRLHRKAFIATAIFSFFINLLMLSGPLFMLQIYDRVLPSRSVPTLVALFVLVLFLYALMGLLELVRSRVLVRISMKLDQQLSTRLFNAEMRVNLMTGGNTNIAALRELDTLRQFMTGPGPFALFDSPWVPIYILVIFLFHWSLGVLAIIGAIILFAIAILNDIRTRTPLEEANMASGAAMKLAEAGRRNAEVLQAIAMLGPFRNMWMREHEVALSHQAIASDRAGSLTAFSKSFRMFLQSATLGVGAYLAVQQQISPGTMIAASIILSRALQPVEQSIGQWRGFVRARKAFQTLNDLMEKVKEPDERIKLAEPTGRLSVKGLRAMVPATRQVILTGKGISFDLNPGQTLGVIGPSGSGKSTLAKAILGVWPLEGLAGSVEIDGVAHNKWDPEQLGAQIGYLPQDVELFPGTVKQNISRFHPTPDDMAIIDASEKAGVSKMITDLPNGYETDIGFMGANLSAGQRQRVGLARALYGNPALIVLDEPNSNLDSTGEEALESAIGKMRDLGKTVIVISHRAEALKNIDYLMLLARGEMMLFGPRNKVINHLQELKNKRQQPGQGGGTAKLPTVNNA